MELVADGRNARRQANRRAVLDALVAFLNEGVLEPTVDELIKRAGVSERSLFRYFDGLEDLRAAAVTHAFGDVAHLLQVPASVPGPLPARIRALVNRRLDLFEAIAGVARLARARELEVPNTAVRIQRFREQLMAQVAVQFAPELERLAKAEAERVLMACTVLLSFESWDAQTRGYGRSRAKVRATLVGALSAILGAGASDEVD